MNTAVTVDTVREHSTWNMALNIKRLHTRQPAPIIVLLITFSLVGATQGSVYCSPLHYCHVASVVAMVWPLRHVLWISIIIHSLICAEDITGLHKYHFVSSWGVPESHIYNRASAVDVVWCYDKAWKWEMMLVFLKLIFIRANVLQPCWPNHDTAVH